MAGAAEAAAAEVLLAAGAAGGNNEALLPGGAAAGAAGAEGGAGAAVPLAFAPTLADTSDRQLKRLASVKNVNFAGTRAQVQQRLETANNNWTEEKLLHTLPAEDLRNWAMLEGLPHHGARAAIAMRIFNKALRDDAPPPPAQQQQQTTNNEERAADNPRDIKVVRLSSLQDTQRLELWEQDIQSIVAARNISPLWQALVDPSTVQSDRETMNTSATPREKQQLVLLEQGMRNSLSDDIRATYQAAIRANNLRSGPEHLLIWIKEWLAKLGDSAIQKAMGEFAKMTWKQEGGDLASFHAKLSGCASEFGEFVPEGLGRERLIRGKIIANVCPGTNKAVDLILTEFTIHRCDEVNFTNTDLVTKLSVELFKQESSAEKQCSVFANIAPLESADAMMMTANRSHHNSHTMYAPKAAGVPSPTLGAAADPSIGGHNVNVFFNSGGKGKGKGNGCSTFPWGNQQTTLCCNNCRNHWREQGREEEKRHQWTSHNSKDCKFTGQRSKKKQAVPNHVPHANNNNNYKGAKKTYKGAGKYGGGGGNNNSNHKNNTKKGKGKKGGGNRKGNAGQ